jgi:hypothetical protein
LPGSRNLVKNKAFQEIAQAWNLPVESLFPQGYLGSKSLMLIYVMSIFVA